MLGASPALQPAGRRWALRRAGATHAGPGRPPASPRGGVQRPQRRGWRGRAALRVRAGGPQAAEEAPVALTEAAPSRPASALLAAKQEGPSANLSIILERLQAVGGATLGASPARPPACLPACLPAYLPHTAPAAGLCAVAQAATGPAPLAPLTPRPSPARALQLLWPYWTESDERVRARWKLAGVFALTLGTTGVRWAGGRVGGRQCVW